MTDLVLNAVCAILLAFVTATAVICYFQCPDKRLRQSYTAVGFCMFGWLISVILYRSTESGELAVYFDNLPFPFIAFLPVSVFTMTLFFYNRGEYATKRNIVLISLIPFCTTLVALVPQLSFLLRHGHVMVSTGPLHLAAFTWNWWFYLHTAYSYLVSMASVLLAVSHHRKQPSGYGIPSGLLVASIICTLAGNLYSIVNRSQVDSTMVTSSLATVIIYIAIASNPGVEYLAIAHKQLVADMDQAVFVLGKQGQVVEVNNAALNWLKAIGFSDSLPYEFDNVLDCLEKRGGVVKDSFLHTADQNVFLQIGDEMVVYTLSKRQVADRKSQIMGSYIALTDITQYSQMISQLEQEAEIDYLTGIGNRRVFEMQYKQMDTVENLPISLILADVNGLKMVNDRYGHQIGDKLLCSVARAMVHICPQNGVAARIGGDEFALIAPNCSGEDIQILATAIKDALREEKNEMYTPSVALGFATKMHVSQNLQELLVEADNKMYIEKGYDRRR